jgi:hypothetical protein
VLVGLEIALSSIIEAIGVTKVSFVQSTVLFKVVVNRQRPALNSIMSLSWYSAVERRGKSAIRKLQEGGVV